MTALEKKLFRALTAAQQHLDYCGYGDKWERECAEASGLEEQIKKALAATEKSNVRSRS